MPTLARNVVVNDPAGVLRTFSVGDSNVPDWAQRLITNPEAWEGGVAPYPAGPASPATTSKAAVRVATTANLASVADLPVVDGVQLVAGDRVLVKNQTDQTKNGIYSAGPGAWPRTGDADTAVELAGASVAVRAGTQKDTAWIVTTADPVVLGTSNIVWEKLTDLGAPKSFVTTMTADFTAADGGIYIVDATGGPVNVTVPVTSGLMCVVKKHDNTANAVTIFPQSGTIEKTASLALTTQSEGRILYSDGTNVIAAAERRAIGTGILPVAATNAAGTSFKLARDDHAHAGTVAEFEIDFLAKALSNVNFATFTQASARFHGGSRLTDNTTQNNEVVFVLPAAMQAGTWTVVLTHHQASTFGIYTIAVSADASTWTTLGTVDGYSLAGATNQRAELTGLAVAAGMRYIRLKMATKNASSGAYGGDWTLVSGLRTGA